MKPIWEIVYDVAWRDDIITFKFDIPNEFAVDYFEKHRDAAALNGLAIKKLCIHCFTHKVFPLCVLMK